MQNRLRTVIALSSESTPVAPSQRHSVPTIVLHWATVLAIVIAAVAGLWRDWSTDPGLRSLLMAVHKQAGLFVLVALVLRLAARSLLGFADHAGPMPAAMRWAAKLAHLALYALLLALPVIGLALCAASAMDVSLFGLVRLPALLEDDPDVAATLSDAHVWAAWALLCMVTMHVAAALWHHHVRRDGVLAAMLPTIKPRRSPMPGPTPPNKASRPSPAGARAALPLKYPFVEESKADAPATGDRKAKKYGTG